MSGKRVSDHAVLPYVTVTRICWPSQLAATMASFKSATQLDGSSIRTVSTRVTLPVTLAVRSAEVGSLPWRARSSTIARAASAFTTSMILNSTTSVARSTTTTTGRLPRCSDLRAVSCKSASGT